MARKGPEAIFQKDVIDLAHTLGWRVAHFRTSMNSRGHYMTAVAADGAGFPDLCMVRRGRIVFAELKAPDGSLSAKQKEWIDALVEAQATTDYTSTEVYVWKPKDLELIMKVLR